jgi:PAS domain S-box-containing protein
MSSDAPPGPPLELDDRLTEHRTLWAEALRAVATSWRFRASAGRLSGHSLPGVLGLATLFEQAANLLLEPGPRTAARAEAPGGQVEVALRESEEQFRLLVDSVIDYGIFILDTEGHIRTWNAGAERIKGWRAEEIIGRPFTLFYEQEARDRKHPEEELKFATRDGHFHEEGWRVRKDGSRFWADVTITALRDSTGRLRGFAKVTRDLTERAKQEQALREANASLEQRVEERTADLMLLNEELKSFSYSVSHDLRAPLRAIDGFSKVLMEDYAEGQPLDAPGLRYLERIRTNAQRMAVLIDELLKLSRVTRAELRVAPVDLAALAREVLEGLARQAPGRAVSLAIPPTVQAAGDPQLLRIVLENLLGNAWKFTGKQPAPRIEFGVEPREEERLFFVRDNGAGFDMAHADRLFTPFQRLHRNDEFEGTGIGLATIQRVIRRHRGRVWADGKPGEGATFWFTLGTLGPPRAEERPGGS